MPRITFITPVYCDTIPDQVQEGVLYISRKYATAIHLCACGCKREVVTPLDVVGGWKLSEDDGGVSLNPSIGNWSNGNPHRGSSDPYHAHYWIRGGRVEW